MAVLAIGLFAAGIGTMAFVRNALLDNVDSAVQQLANTDATGALFEPDLEGGAPFAPRPIMPETDYFVAVYAPTGDFLASAGGDGESMPIFPEVYDLTLAKEREGIPFTLPNENGNAPYRAAVTVIQLDGQADFYVQLVAVPTAQVNRFVATFLGTYSILALIVLVAGALGTRGLVTLAFRSLGQVESTAAAIVAGDFSVRMSDIEPDTTEVGRLKAAINTMLNRVDDALAERDTTLRQMRRFVGDASHELRTPLVSVRGYAELYRMGALRDDDAVDQAMERIEKEAVRMGILVEDLLALARLDERRNVAFTEVDLRPITHDAALDVQAAAPERTVTVEDTTIREQVDVTTDAVATTPEKPATGRRRGGAAVPVAIAGATLSLLRRRSRGTPEPAAPVTRISLVHAPDPIVLAEDNLVRQVITNLLGNALRYSPDDSPIGLRIGADRTSGTGWIEVIDHGEGIPVQVRDQIFQRFWRADTSRARETGGSGLGLSIVASIMESLHGDVTVSDTPGGGATFRIAIPLAPNEERDAQAAIDTQPIPRLETVPPSESPEVKA